MGFVGFLFELEDLIKKYENGFFIVLYVVIKCYEELYDSKKVFLLYFEFNNFEYDIVYLFWEDNGYVNYKVGEVVELYFGNYGLENIGLDFVVIRINIFRYEGMYVSWFI